MINQILRLGLLCILLLYSFTAINEGASSFEKAILTGILLISFQLVELTDTGIKIKER